MHRLILLRHGKAERSAPGGDIARRLTDRGRNDAALMGRVLAERDLIPDVALVSAAARTQETWAAVSPAFPMARAEAKFSTSSVAAFTFDEAGRPAYDGLFHASDFGGGGGE